MHSATRVVVSLSLLSLTAFAARPLGAQTGIPTNGPVIPAGAADSSQVVSGQVSGQISGRDSAALASPSTAPVASEPSVAGAPLTGLRAGVHRRETARPDQPLVAPNRAGLGQARALMIVGVAALVAGAIIGGTPGTVVMVGGAVIGLIGLYDYLQ